jgi:hypothetical protein
MVNVPLLTVLLAGAVLPLATPLDGAAAVPGWLGLVELPLLVHAATVKAIALMANAVPNSLMLGLH